MPKVAVVTDSTATIPNELLAKYQICVAPQVLIWDGVTLLDRIDIQADEFYSRLAKSSTSPTTSQATPASFHKIYSDLLAQGYDVLSILLSAKLSGTIESAKQAKEMLGSPNIEIVDSQTTAMAMGFQVLSAARLAAEGASLAEVKALAERATQHTGVIFAVDTLEFLHRGGRIGGGAKFLATAFSIKPILEIKEGRVEALERIRTRKKSLARLVELIVERVGDRKPVRLATLHANAPEEARWLLDEAGSKLDVTESIFTDLSPVVGTHAGPGTVGLAFMAGL